MELLEFARGPALTFAIAVFIGGVVFRIVSIFALWRTRDSSANRAQEKPVVIAALREIIRRMWPETVYRQRTLFTAINGYVFHIGLARRQNWIGIALSLFRVRCFALHACEERDGPGLIEVSCFGARSEVAFRIAAFAVGGILHR